MEFNLIRMIVIVCILATQYFLSSTKYKILGLIMPILCTIYSIYFYLTENWPLWAVCLLLILFLIILGGEYKSGQQHYKKRKNLELNKMKSHDL